MIDYLRAAYWDWVLHQYGPDTYVRIRYIARINSREGK